MQLAQADLKPWSWLRKPHLSPFLRCIPSASGSLIFQQPPKTKGVLQRDPSVSVSAQCHASRTRCLQFVGGWFRSRHRWWLRWKYTGSLKIALMVKYYYSEYKTDLVAGSTLNSSAAYLRTAVKGVPSGTPNTCYWDMLTQMLWYIWMKYSTREVSINCKTLIHPELRSHYGLQNIHLPWTATLGQRWG